MAPCNRTQQWHHVHSTKVGPHLPPNHSTLQWHPTKAPSNGTTATAPCNGTTSTQPQHTTMAPCNGTQQWHHVHSTIAHYNGTQQWHHVHSTIAHYNGTQQWHHVHSTIAHYNGTQQWHHVPLHPAMAFWCHVQCAKVVRRPPPIGSKNPYSYRYMGNNLFHSILVRSKSTTLLEDRPCLTSICQAHLSKIHAVIYSDKIGSFPLPPNMGNTNQETLKTHENNTLMPISVQNGPNRWKQRYLVKWCVEVC